MAKLIYSAITSLDGYVADENGNFDWAAPDEEVHAFVNDLERPIGTYLYGRRMYEVMAVWETADTWAEPVPVMQRLRRDLAGRRQGRVLDDPRRRRRPPDADRAELRPRRGSADESAAANATSASAVRSSPRRRSEPAWSTRSTSSSRRSWSAEAKRVSPARVRLELELLRQPPLRQRRRLPRLRHHGVRRDRSGLAGSAQRRAGRVLRAPEARAA